MAPGKKELIDHRSEANTENPQAARPTLLPIVGIGASAGGLEAVSELLRQLPPDTGMGFVLVQHLDPKHASVLTEILSKSTSMTVSEVTHGMNVVANQVYVIPPNVNMVIESGVLKLTPRAEARGRHMPVDCFLRSLAKDPTGQPIAVILSGSGSDGTLGVNDVKAQGGITFAQDETAKYQGMPRNAIATGHVDFVLPPKRIAEELVRISTHPYLGHRRIQDDEPVPSEVRDDLTRILVLLRRAKGIDFSLYKQGTLNRRIARRLALRKLRNLEDYLCLLREDASEVEALFQDILIHVTGFFRDPEAFETLKTVAFPTLVTTKASDDPLRVWVPGCSTGEEVYSIAISLLEFLGNQAGSISFKIFATDICDQAIETARAGTYLESISGDVSPDRLRRFFVKAGRGYEVNKTIRETCIFAKQDVTKDPPFSNLDLISCRNVLIYFDLALQKKVLPLFHYALKPTGFLMLGSSEAASQFAKLFHLEEKKHKIYSKKPAATLRIVDFPVNDRRTPPVLRGEREGEPPPGRLDLNEEVDRFLLEKYSPAGVVIDQDLRIIQVRGETGPYLQLAPGMMSADVLKMARHGLQLVLRAAIKEAQRSGGTVVEEGLHVKTNHHYADVNLHVVPLKGQDSEGRYFLVLFEKATRSARPESTRTGHRTTSWFTSMFRLKGAPFWPRLSAESTESEQMARLRDELHQTKRHLQSLVQEQEAANEELRSANEEILSANEELLSINEELETAKEELQAANEELGTVNEELQNRNLEASKLNDDLNNLLSSTDIPIIMLGGDLRIRRFTPTAAKVLNLISSDVGRPIGDLKLKINVSDLENVIEEVVETHVPREREAQGELGYWYRMHVRPYRTLGGKVEGVVITLLDIHKLKVTEEALRDEGTLAGKRLHHSEAKYRAVIDNAMVGVVTISESGVIETFNPTAERMFGYQASEVIGENVKTLMPSLYRERHEGYFADYLSNGEKEIMRSGREVEGRRKNGTTFPMDLFVSQIDDGESRGFTAILHDITERKQAEDGLRRMSQVFMDSADPIMIMDLSGRITDVNAEAQRDYRGTREELVGRPLKAIVPPERHEQVDDLMRQCRQGKVVRNVEGLRLRKSGSSYPVLFTLFLLTDGCGEGIAIANIAKDITELKRAGERLLQSERLAAIGQAMTGLAHESRNALQQSQASLEMLARRIENRPETVELVADIQKAQDDLHALYEEVRQYASPLRPNRERCDLREIVERAWADLDVERRGRRSRLTQQTGDLDVHCKVDRSLFRRLIRNLLENSLSAKEDSIDVEVRYSETAIGDGPALCMQVGDNGPGLTDEERARIFEAFYTTKPEGTGLGMAIAKRIVEAHGGQIEVGCHEGSGTEIVVILPWDER